MFAHPAKYDYNLAVHEPEVPGIQRETCIRYAVEQPVIELCRAFFEPGFSFSAEAPPIDNVRSFFPFPEHLRDEFGRVLHVGIQDDDGIPGGRIQPGSDGDLLPEVAGQVNDLYVRIHQCIKNIRGTVRTAIIDKKDFVGIFRVPENACHAFIARLNDRFLVVGRDDGLFLWPEVPRRRKGRIRVGAWPEFR